MATGVARGRKNVKIDEATKAQVLQKVDSMSAESLNAEFSGMQLNIQNSIAHLQTQVLNKYATADELDTAISLKTARLKDLHNIEATAVQLDDLEAQLEQQRQQIQKERDDADQAQFDRQQAWDKEKKRLEDEWVYNTDQQHRKKMDEFNQNLLKQQREEAVRQEALQKNWKEREEKLTADEAELESLRKQVSDFPKTLDSEVKKQNAILENSIKREYETKISLLAKDAEVNQKLNKERETALQNTINRLETQADSLIKQVQAAEERAAQVAKTAFESVSGRDALAAVQRHGEQAQPQLQGKGGR